MTATDRWTDLRVRLLSGIVLIAVGGFSVVAGGACYTVLIFATMLGLVWEGLVLARQPHKNWRGLLLLAWPLAAGAAACKGDWHASFVVVAASLVFGRPACMPVMVAALGGLSLLWLRALPHGLENVLLVFGVVIASDSFAYLTGRLCGGPKLAPRISPGKTRAGALGGLVGAALVGGMIARLTGLGPMVGGVFWGGVLGVCAQTGDLAESALKRRLGVKDTGTLIPGHGGLLDRFDGLLAAAPVAALVSLLVSHDVFWSLGFAHYPDVSLSLPVVP